MSSNRRWRTPAGETRLRSIAARQNALQAARLNPQQAPNIFQSLLADWPDDGHVHVAFALHRIQRSDFDGALALLRRATELRPTHAETWETLAALLQSRGHHVDAYAAVLRALELDDSRARVHSVLGTELHHRGELHRSIAHYHRALELEPNHLAAMNNIANVLQVTGHHIEAARHLERSLALDTNQPHPHSAFLQGMNYRDDLTASEVFDAHRQWAKQHVASTAVLPAATPINRRVRVGLVSADFREHSVAFFLLPLLGEHDRDRLELFAYSMVRTDDATTKKFRTAADQWLDVADWPDEQVLERIRSDAVDVLIDLAGHTAGHRLCVFGQRAAPVQLSYLGYPNTTGLDAMDFRLVDAVTDPPGESDVLHSETLIRLPGCFLCYNAPQDANIEVAPPPVLRREHITFGSFNNGAKLSDSVIALWSEILGQVNESQLLLKARGLQTEFVREHFLEKFASHSISTDRLQFRGLTDTREGHLHSYGEVDIALDTFPYNGTTTTCEALWMGVPVVTLRGDRHAGRVGASLCAAVGASDWVAESPQDYVRIAAALASDPQALAMRRQLQRAQVESSSLCDTKTFAANFSNVVVSVCAPQASQNHFGK